MSVPRPFESSARDLPVHRQRIEARRIRLLDEHYARWLKKSRDALPGIEPALSCRFLVEHIAAALERIRDLQRDHGEFARQIGRRPDPDAVAGEHLLSYARRLGARGGRLRGDERALARDFGIEALNERFRRRLAGLERDVCLAAAFLGLHAAATLRATCARNEEFALRWRQIGVEPCARALLGHEGNSQVRLEGLRCFASALTALPRELHAAAAGAYMAQRMFRPAQDPGEEIWLQCEALALLAQSTPGCFTSVARLRLSRPAVGDDLFVRRRCVALIADTLAGQPEAIELLELAAGDPAPFVRQGVAMALPGMPRAAAMKLLGRLLADGESAVRGQGLLAMSAMLPSLGGAWFAETLCAVLARSETPFVHRVALHVAEQGVEAALAAGSATADWGARLLANADQLAASASDLQVRQWAAEAAEWLRLQLEPRAREQLRALARAAGECPPGNRQPLPAALSQVQAERLGRIAQVAARGDFGLHFERGAQGWILHRGHRLGLRAWRLLHELRHPSPEKRQAYRHTIARIFGGTVQAPSSILAEVAETSVPGEPLRQASEAGWRPYLPLPDQLLSLLDEPLSAGPLQIHTPFGVTHVLQPQERAARLRARVLLMARIPRLSALRNWHEGARTGPGAYLRAVRKLGFEVRFEPYPDRSPNPAVQRFFAIGAPLGDGELWQRVQSYFFSVYENTLHELALFVTLAIAGFVGHHVLANYRLRRARAAIPLVIGGWGTRGKSGTERLKAALFNSLGYGVVSKTTGCEAALLHAPAFQPLRELLLFRPYDKATIWEQHQVTRLAQELGADVLLWECMALTPDFVRLLQKRWMRDDMATITNALPDHEDLQGPAGVNIAESISQFIPDRGTVITSEEQMLPILAEAAARAGSRLIRVGWLESGLITPEVLARFPYKEHPDNIALVLRLGAELGIDPDYAIREMADRVVPDLGALRVFEPAPLNHRRLSFANGMSANERFGCLDNWTRLGFDRFSVDQVPGTLVSTVVNNRADRIARSQVFARLLVDDLRADRHFLIGDNLGGLLGYVREAWDARAAGLTLRPENGAAPLAVLDAEALRLRLPCSATQVRARLAATLAGCGLDAALAEHWQDAKRFALAARAGAGEALAAEIARFLEADLAQLAEYREFAQRIGAAARDAAALDKALQAFLWRAFKRKLVVIWDHHASGNQVIQVLADHTPPGWHNRVMGIQNIKGTGLDFVHCWLAWERCHRACRQLASEDCTAFRDGLRALAEFQEFGLLCETTVRDALTGAAASPHAESELVQAELRLIGTRLRHRMAGIRDGLGRIQRPGPLERIVRAFEGFVDAGDALWRRRRADQVYRDLAAERISMARAISLVLALNQRQKGGWLYHSLAGSLERLRDGFLAMVAGERLTRGDKLPWRPRD